MKFIFLWTDLLLYLLLIVSVIAGTLSYRRLHVRAAWHKVLVNPLAIVALVVLQLYMIIGVMDSIHFQKSLVSQGSERHYGQANSLLDAAVAPLGQRFEKTYSAPFADHLFVKEMMTKADGSTVRDYPRLRFATQNIHSDSDFWQQIFQLSIQGMLYALLIWIALISLYLLIASRNKALSLKTHCLQLMTNKTRLPWRLYFMTWLVVLIVLFVAFSLSHEFHILGTDKVGQSIFYLSLKSIRTGLLIGTLTTLVMLPFAVLLGIAAGYFGGLIDDIIQYIYTTLSSIPGVLLIAASILSLQVYIANHPEWFPTLLARSDARLLALCIILGITSWTSLCRMLRAETLKIREIDYIQAANALGTSHRKIITKHILPNVMHLVLIAVVLDFSMLVLAEAVLSYVGVGVAPTTASWGNMINSARLELAREPIVWWPISAAFIFMFTLVLSANLFADAVRDGFDPRV